MSSVTRSVRRRIERALPSSLAARVEEHLGSLESVQLVHHDFPPYRDEVPIVVQRFLEAQEAELHGFFGSSLALVEWRLSAERDRAPAYETIVRQSGDTFRGVSAVLALLDLGGPVALHARHLGERHYRLTAFAGERDRAEAALAAYLVFEREQDDLAETAPMKVAGSLNRRVQSHLEATGAEVVQHDYAAFERTNVAVLLLQFLDAHEAEVVGAEPHGLFGDEQIDAQALLEAAKVSGSGELVGYAPAPATFERVRIEEGQHRTGLVRGVAFLRLEDAPLVIIGQRVERGLRPGFSLAVLAPDRATAVAALDRLVAYVDRHSIFRHRMIRPQLDYDDSVREAEIMKLDVASFDDVVLPEPILHRVQRDVVDYVRHADALVRNGLSVRRGLLLHGPPGVGKTHLCRVLASQLEGFTTIVCAGVNLHRPVGAFRLARKLAPALLLFEDVDLVGEERSLNPASAVMGGLLNELDGLEHDELIVVVFTTNHLDRLEDALAQRPGRVDVVLELPLPGPELRRRLLRQYAGCADLSQVDLEPFVERTDGCTPAFLRELLKSAVLEAIAAGRGGEGAPAAVESRDVEAALTRLGDSADPKLQRIVGFRR